MKSLPIFMEIDVTVDRLVNKWDNLQKQYNKFKRYMDHTLGGGDPWQLNPKDLKKVGLHSGFIKDMYDEMNEWYGKFGKFQENVHTLDTLKKHEHVDVGEISRCERNEDNDKSKLKGIIETIDVGERIERSKLKREVETTNIGEASSGRKKKIDPEVEETLYLLKQRDQILSENLEAQARF